ncbi:MAG: DedA family protein [Cellulosilyticaceae bacterium]
MTFDALLAYMSDYGLFFLALIIFLEYLNLPGFPAGIILPLGGFWASQAKISLWLALFVSVGAAVVASWILYLIGWWGGEFILKKYFLKFPKQQVYIEKQLEYLRSKGNIGVFISKLIPIARTIIAIPAGVLQLNFWKYTLSSTLGIFIWNGVLIGSGYFFGNDILNYLM